MGNITDDITRLIRQALLGDDLPMARALAPEIPKDYRQLILGVLHYERSMDRLRVVRGAHGNWVVMLPASVYPAGHGPAVGTLKSWALGCLAIMLQLEEMEQVIAAAAQQEGEEVEAAESAPEYETPDEQTCDHTPPTQHTKGTRQWL